MKEKIKELAKKYQIPVDLLEEVLAMEKDKITASNRRLVPKLVEAIERYSESYNS